MGLGQGYAVAPTYSEQLAFLSVATVHDGGEEGCVLESCCYRYAGLYTGTGSRA